MCGIVGVVRRRATRPVPDAAALVQEFDRALVAFGAMSDAVGGASLTDRLHATAAAVEEVDAALRGVPGVRALLGDPQAALLLADRVEQLTLRFDALERDLDDGLGAALAVSELERVNAALVRARDAVWAVGRDRLRTAREVATLAGADPSLAALEAFHSVQVALSAIDRLEVRGRDSAGLHLLVRHHGLDLDEPAIGRLIDARASDPLFGSGSVRAVDRELAFVYKAAAEIGELGDNTAVLRSAIRDDALLHLALAHDDAEVMVLGHTRWASVGIISEANAHPLNHEELDGADRPYVVGALNGDVDNYADLKALEGLQIPAEITTDAKVIPALVARRIESGATVEDAFRTTVSELAGSMGIAAQAADAPDRLLLSLRGSGQALYVGMVEDAYVVASEPYGLVEETPTYLRMDGETPADPERASATRGQVVVLDATQAGTLAGIERYAFDGTPLPVHDDELQHAEITTRDIDRGEFPHFLLKEISEAPASFRKTLRGKVVERDGRLAVALGTDTLPESVRTRLREGSIRRVVVIGQGTAAIAGQSLAAVLTTLADDHVRADAVVATEFSGFQLRDDMADTLVVAISQSGTTTDTNRTCDLARARGAAVVAIVNRRNSDLVDKSDGVLYTSDGRDVEMAVPSTKAFYAQIAAGYLLAIAIADELGADAATSNGGAGAVDSPDAAVVHEILDALRSLPDAMTRVLRLQSTIAGIAQRHAVSRRYWAVVGNGRNRIAAAEVRVKASELCYKSISFDSTEDKKHIDLSAEPLVLVCAAGLQGSNADDVAKEIAIYRAHRAAPIVIATEGERRFGAALETIGVPAVHPDVAFVLSAMAGHLFGYEAALAIDTSARPLREVRAAVAAVVSHPAADTSSGDDLLLRLGPTIEGAAATFLDGLRVGSYDGDLEAGTAVRITSLLRYATGLLPLDVYQIEHGAVGTPSRVVEDLTAALTAGIEELTRPVDAIKHQAKTVTVGISRSDEELLQVALAREVLAAGAARDALSYRALRTLVALDPAVEQLMGFTRYRIEGDLAGDDATIHVVDRGGISVDLRSRTDDDPRLLGTKHRVATQREVTVARGRRDGRTMVIVPEVKDNVTVGLTLLHARFAAHLAAEVARTVLQGYQGRYGALRDAVTETTPTFDDARLATFDLVDLLTEPVYVLADRWR
jgi:glutamine---fructose-6-phosphate transaminase (isomerizing)